MKTILILGSPNHSKWIVQKLISLDSKNKYETEKNLCSYKGILKILKADIIFFIFVPTTPKYIFFMQFLKFIGKELVFEWIGTDVISLKKIKNKSIYQKGKNLCEVNWIKEELISLGIKSFVGPFITRLYHGLDSVNKLKSNRKDFVVMSYSLEGKEEFYGIDTLLEVAKDLPNITFKILGTKGFKYKKVPQNVYFLGWIESTKELLEEISLFIRIPKHDGLSLSVLEALYYGKQVIFSYKFEGAIYVESDNTKKLQAEILNLYNCWIKGDDLINYKGKKYVEEIYFNKQDESLYNLKEKLTSS